jgi:hypothetical protein
MASLPGGRMASANGLALGLTTLKFSYKSGSRKNGGRYVMSLQGSRVSGMSLAIRTGQRASK